MRLLVSSSAYKKLGSSHYILTSKNLNRLEKATTPQIHKRGKDTVQTTGPKTGESDRCIQVITINRSKTLGAETAMGANARVGKPELQFRVKTLGDHSQGLPQFTSRSLIRFPQQISENNLLELLPRGKEKALERSALP